MTKKNTLNLVFKNDAGDIVTVAGANIVHKDLKATMNALIPSVFRLLTVDTITLSDEESKVSLSGNRILQNGMVIKVESPQIGSNEGEHYDYCSELFLAIEAVIYEAKQYWNESKWGIKEGDLDFGADDPFDGKVTTDQVPQADVVQPETKKKTKKAKQVKVA